MFQLNVILVSFKHIVNVVDLKSLFEILFCPSCEKGLRDIPELKQLITQLLVDVNELNISKGTNLPISDDFIINK